MKIRTILKYLNLGYELQIDGRTFLLKENNICLKGKEKGTFIHFNVSLDDFIKFCDKIPDDKIAEITSMMKLGDQR